MKKLLILETDSWFINKFKQRLAAQQLNNYEVILVDPTSFSFDNDEMVEKSYSKILELVQSENVYGIFIDISFNDEINDGLGIKVAVKIKHNISSIPVFCITNKTKSEVDYSFFCTATIEGLDGVFTKRFLTDTTFSKALFNKIFENAYLRIKAKNELLGSESKPGFDVAVISALKFELDAFANLIAEKTGKISKSSLVIKDSTHYHTANIQCNNEKIRIVYATEERMGMPSITSLASRMIINFRPKYIVIIGIAAGVPDDTKIGDLLVAANAYDYGSGKLKLEKTGEKELDNKDIYKEVFVPYGDHIPLDEKLRNDFVGYKQNEEFLKKMCHGFPDYNKYDFKHPELHLGPFASGSAVVANENVVNNLKKNEGKLIGFDMEVYGMFAAARTLQGYANSTKPIALKAVSDHGDSHKNNPNKDLFQKYAAYISANFLINYLKNEF